MPAKALLVGGTASHVGKSWMATAICRWLFHQGIKVAPFKAQNMSNNSYPCLEGGEIGRAQVAQAEACGLAPSLDMNPILLKPTSDMGSQVIVHGKVWKNLSGRRYYEHHEFLREKAYESFSRLMSKYDFIVAEGAGSIAELNLRQTDIVNLALARHFEIPVLLVADIDRGGVFGSLYGTITVLNPAERNLIRAFAANRFRGDSMLFCDGRKIIEEKTGKPCLGVFPFAPDIHLDQEDTVDLEEHRESPTASNVAIVHFPHISNHTDFRLLRNASWIERPIDRRFSVVILPGTRSTMSDLGWFRAQGLEAWLRKQHSSGAKIVGICGGYQMLGRTIRDPHHMESQNCFLEGLGLLPVETTLLPEKTTRVVIGRTKSGTEFRAYEIHIGETAHLGRHDPFAHADDRPEGISANRCFGTYLHGAFEHAAVLREYLNLEIDTPCDRELMFDRMADWFADSADIRLFEEQFLS